MPLNYSKWDMLELSDDSDIEEHPNVDKKSMIRWKQREIHEQREARRIKLLQLNSELSLNATLRPRIQAILSGVSDKGVGHFRSVQRRIREQPSDAKPQTGAANQPTYDQMIGQLLGDVWREACWVVDGRAEVRPDGVFFTEGEKKGTKLDEKAGEVEWASGDVPEGKKERLGEVLQSRLEWHVRELERRDGEVRKEMEEVEREQKKKITSEDIREGWDSSSISKAKESPLDDRPKVPQQPKKQEKQETIEVLNPASSSKSAIELPKPDEDDEELPEFGPLTPSGRAFAQIPLGDFEKSYEYIQRDSSVLTERMHDSLLAEAFDAERRGDKALARRCVHQSLLVNYCRQLGRDGVGLFFQKMITKNPKSIQMFNEDLQRTYTRIAERTVELAAEAPEEREQIQLVAEDPSMQISFNLPDGPPPAELRIEGEGAEEMDMEQVRAFLQMKWETFEAFPEDMQRALRTEKLDEVNRVLGRMKVAEAEEVVERMQEAGMLSFSERGVRDMTKA